MKTLFLAILAMLCWGIGPIFSKLGLNKIEPFTALTVRTVAIAGIMVLAGVFSGKLAAVTQVNLRSAAFIVADGVFAALLGQLAYYYAIKGGQVSLVTPMVAAFPLVTVLLAIIILGETPTMHKLAGAILIVAGLLIIQR